MDNYNFSDMGNNQAGSIEERNIKKTSERWFNRTGGACCIHLVITVLISMIITMIITLSGIISGHNMEQITESAMSGKMTLITLTFSYLIGNVSAAAIALAFIKKLRHSAKMMFSKPEINFKLILLGIPAAMFIQTVSMLLQSVFVSVSGSSGMENMEMPDFIKGDPVNNILLIAYVVFIGPITEEIFFRGAVMKGFNFASRKFAIVFSSVLFALFHGNIIQGIIAFLLGIFFGYLDMKSGSLIPSVILHITNNGIATLLSYIEYKTGEELSDSLMIIYIICTLLIGGICMIFLMRSLKGKEMSENNFFTPQINADSVDRNKYGIKSVVRCPLVWVCVIIYTIMIIANIL